MKENRQTLVEKTVAQLRDRSQEGKAVIVLRCSQERDIRRVVEAFPYGTTWKQVKNRTKDSPWFQKQDNRKMIQEATAYETVKPMCDHFSWKSHGPDNGFGNNREPKLLAALEECVREDTALQRNVIYIPNLKKLLEQTNGTDNILRGQYVQVLKQIAWDKMDGKTNALVVIGCTDGWLCEELKEVTYIMDIPCPDTWELAEIIQDACRRCDGGRMGLSTDRLNALAEVMRGFREDDVRKVIASAFRECQDPTAGLAAPLFRAALDCKRQIITGIQGLKWVDVDITELGGVATVQAWMNEKQLIFAYPWLAKRQKATDVKGMLLAGLPGSGKTTAAKYAAVLLGGTGGALPLLQLTLSDLKSKWYSESEANLTAALQAVENVSPAVLILDELDKVGGSVPSGGNNDVGGGLLQILLEWLQKDKEKPVFVVVACNYIRNLDSSLIRKGRLDEIFFLGFPTAKEVEDIFRVHLKRWKNMILHRLGTGMNYVPAKAAVEIGESASWEEIQSRLILSVLHKCARKERFLCGADVDSLLKAAFQKLLVDTLEKERQQDPDSVQKLNGTDGICFQYTPETVAAALLSVVGSTRSYFDNHFRDAAYYWLDMYEQQILEAGAEPYDEEDPEDDLDLQYAGLAAAYKEREEEPQASRPRPAARTILPADRDGFDRETGKFSPVLLKQKELLADASDVDTADYPGWIQRQKNAAKALEDVHARYDGIFRWNMAREIYDLLQSGHAALR